LGAELGNWTQRTKELPAIWFMRVMIGAMWFHGSPVSGGFAGCTGSLAQNAAFGFHRWIAKNVVIPLLPVVNAVVFLTELPWRSPLFSASSCGRRCHRHAVRRASLAGLSRRPGEWPWLCIPHPRARVFFVLNDAGRA